jgi:hypothetical protein
MSLEEYNCCYADMFDTHDYDASDARDEYASEMEAESSQEAYGLFREAFEDGSREGEPMTFAEWRRSLRPQMLTAEMAVVLDGDDLPF